MHSLAQWQAGPQQLHVSFFFVLGAAQKKIVHSSPPRYSWLVQLERSSNCFVKAALVQAVSLLCRLVEQAEISYLARNLGGGS